MFQAFLRVPSTVEELQNLRSFTSLRRILGFPNGRKIGTVQECVVTTIIISKKFWAIEVRTGKMQKFGTVSS